MADTSTQSSGGLFQGQQFWLSQNIPQRSRFKEIIEQNGGMIRLLEKDADVKLVDHARKINPPDTYSYKYIEESVRNGRVENLEKYRAGSSSHRPVGAHNIPTRHLKKSFSIEDDQILWDWMQEYEKIDGAPIRGNRIYMDLAEKHPQHTYQSWRDRYLKRLRERGRPGGEVPSRPATQPPNHTPPATQPRVAPNEDIPRPTQEPPPSSAPSRLAAPKRKRKSDRGISHPQESHSTEAPQAKRRAAEPVPEKPATSRRPVEQKPQKSSQPQRTPEHISKGNPAPTEDSHPRHEPIEQLQPKESQSKNTTNQIDSVFLELPFLPETPEPEPPEPNQSIDDWMDERLNTGKAQDADQLARALQCTSMDPDLTDKVLEYLVAGKDIPQNMPGVWTPQDDRDMEGQDGRRIKALLEKHGSEYVDQRWEYLRMARDTGFEPIPSADDSES